MHGNPPANLDYQQLLIHRRSHPAWRLMLADHAPMIASFLHQSFVVQNARGIPRAQLASQLDDHLFRLHETTGETLFPKASTAYLDDWASDQRGWLRKYYPSGTDEPHYDLVPDAELALGWMHRTVARPVIGTEARLSSVFALLREIVDGTELNPRARVATLRRRQAEIDAEITRIEQGSLALMEPAAIRERYLQAADTAQTLLMDLRALEQNFRSLYRSLREQIATGAHDSGRDPLAETDEGASFLAFRDMLMSPSRQDELTGLLEQVMALEPVRELKPDARLRRIHYDWLDSAEAAQHTLVQLSAQLRRHSDDRAGLENRRIMQLIRGIEQRAVALRGRVAEPAFMDIDDASPTLGLPMDRTLFSPPFRPRITHQALAGPDAAFPSDALFGQVHVDQLRLVANVRHALATRPQVSLGAIAAEYPIEHGLAELTAYLTLATDDLRCVIDEEHTEVVRWLDAGGQQRQATLPLVIYTL
jgi:hypothetical protein